MFVAVGVVRAAVSAGEIRVSPDGVSPQAALERIRAAKAAGDRSAWTVRVAPGLYALDRTLVFTPADSGTPEAPVRWVAEEGEAVFSGGGLIGGWKDAGNGVWEAPLPRDANGKPIWFQSLFANGRRAQRARHPEKGFFAINGWRETATTNGADILYHEHYTVKDRAADALTGLSAQELAAVEFQIRCKWSYGSYSVLGWNPETRELSASGREGVKSWKRPDERGTLFAFENVRAGFDTPGEWFYDVTEGKVKYRPLPGEKLADFRALAPLSQLVSIIRFDGDPERGKYVTDISFEGITVTCSRTDGDRLPNGFIQQYQYQAGAYAGGSVFAKGTRRLSFENCRIFGVENYAMRFDIGCVSSRIAHCTFEHLGAGGLWIGGGKSNLFKKPGGWKEQRTPFTRPIPYGDPAVAHTHPCAFFTVEDCTIRHAGLVNPEGCGIVLTHVSDSSVTHCDISDLYYTGISVGWTWGYTGSVSQRNTIAFNRIWDLGKHVMADMGGIYTLGTSYGTCISNNVIHHVDSVSYGGWGLYNDEGSEGIVLENNLVYDTKDSSYHQHYGRENVVRNNILACSKESQIAVSRPEPHLCVTFLNNIVYWETKTPVFSPGKKPVSEGAGKLAWTNNLFWCAAGPTVINGPNKAIVCDPLFENAAKRDFRLKSGSPAPRYGFKPWDFSTAGRRPADITRALQARIETAAAVGGGEVVVPCGDWWISSVMLKSGVTLRLKRDAHLFASRTIGDYPQMPDGKSAGVINLRGVKNVAIVGEPGSFIDGGNCYNPRGGEGYRGSHAVWAVSATNVTVRGVAVRNSANYAFQFLRCRNTRIEGCVAEGGHDGVHHDLCDGVRVTGCRLETGDDSVAGAGCTDVVISNCVLNSACSPIRYGGRDVLITDCRVTGPAKYPHRWTLSNAEKARGAGPDEVGGRRTTGCFYQAYTGDTAYRDFKPGNIVIRNVTVDGVERFMVSLSGLPAALWQDGNGIPDILFENVRVTGLAQPSVVAARPDAPMRLVFRNCSFGFRTPQKCAFFGKNVKVVSENVSLEPGVKLYDERLAVGYDDIPEFPSWRIEPDEQRAKWGLPPLKRPPTGEDVAETCPVSPKAKGHENIEWNRLWAVHLTDASKDLPRALLVGDSICEEYGGAVERTLAGKVNVDRWASSYCLTSPGYRDLLAASLAVAKYDVVHFNNGLHSLSSDRDLWEAKLEEALRLVRRMQPQSKIVLATSTPLRPERLTAKVRELNERLLAVAGRQALPVNDLFALLDPLDRQAEWSDDFHHKQPVKDRLARQVADKVLQLLGSGCP